MADEALPEGLVIDAAPQSDPTIHYDAGDGPRQARAVRRNEMGTGYVTTDDAGRQGFVGDALVTKHPTGVGGTVAAVDPTLPSGLVLDLPRAPSTEVRTVQGFAAMRDPADPEQGLPPPSIRDEFVQKSALGRIFDAFGQGFRDGFGTSQIGFSEESEKTLREAGIYPDLQRGMFDTLKAFNQAVMQPAVFGLDALARGVMGSITSVAEGVGQTAQELGMAQTEANRLVRDLRILGETGSTLMGAVPGSPVRGGRRPLVEPQPRARGPVAPSRTADHLPPVPEGHVRMFSSAGTEANGSRHATPYFEYARDWDTGRRAVDYVDVPVTHPSLNEITGAMPGDGIKPQFGHSVLPPDIVQQFKPALERIDDPAAPTGAAPPPTNRTQVAANPPDTIYDSFGDSPHAPTDKAGNIRVDNLNKPEDVKQVFRDIAAENGDFMHVRGEPISDVQRAIAAEALGLETKNFNPSIPPGVSWSTWTEAVKRLAIQSAENVRDAMLKAKASGSDADILAYAEARARHMMIQEEYSKVTAEGGRTLNALKKDKAQRAADQSLNDFLKDATGKTIDDLKAEIEAGTRLNSPEQLSRFLNDARKPGFRDMFVEYWINSLVSGPKTHAANMIGNTLTALTSVPETAVAYGIGKVRQLLGNKGERVVGREIGEHIFGIVRGAQEGIVAAYEALKTGKSAFGDTQFQIRESIPGAVGSVVRTPTRLLTMEDEFFKSIAYRAEINRLSARQAVNEGLSGDALHQRIAELSRDPTEDMMARAKANAQYQTFTDELTSKFGQGLMNLSDANVPAKMVLPFVRTPSNILAYSMERTPVLGLALKGIRENFSGANGKVAQDTAYARAFVGSAAMITSYMLAEQGITHGAGPANPEHRAVNYLNGIAPDSICIGEVCYGFNRFQPWATNIAFGADVHDILKAYNSTDKRESEHIGALIGAALTKNVLNVSSLSGVANAVKAASDPDRHGEKWAQNLLASIVVPGIVSQTAAAYDPVMREVNSAFDAIKARSPGLSVDMLPRYDIWGQELVRDGIGPVSMNKMSNDPVNKALLELRVWPKALQKSIDGVKLSPEQYDQYQRMAGRLTKFTLDSIVAMKGFADLPPGVRAEKIKETIETTRRVATQAFAVQEARAGRPEILRARVDRAMKMMEPATK